MPKDHDVIIYMRNISLTVVIPENYVWDFILAFGDAFSVLNVLEGYTEPRAIKSYSQHPNGWHIKVEIIDRDENKFYDFLKNFCEKRNISFRDPRTQ